MRYTVKVFEVPPYNRRTDGPDRPPPVERKDLFFGVTSDTIDGVRPAVREAAPKKKIDVKKIRTISFSAVEKATILLYVNR